MVKEHPILMSSPMVKALLEGRKTQTRRVVKKQPEKFICGDALGQPYFYLDGDPEKVIYCPYGQVGDRLWVRETFKYIDFDLRDMGELHPRVKIEYKADGLQRWVMGDSKTQISIPVPPNEIWRPSIFMPRWASRITLEITDVRVQQVQSICLADIQAEGIHDDRATFNAPKQLAKYQVLWDSINGDRFGCTWHSNPWGWCISFKKVD